MSKPRTQTTAYLCRAGDEVEFKNAVGTYRAKILAPLGHGGATGNQYAVRILAGPDMHQWMVDLPASLITRRLKRSRRRR
jgi:hypothetical protein